MQASPRVKTPAQYLASLPAERRGALQTLHRAIRRAAPGLKPVIVYGMLGYGPYHYVYASGREGDGATVCLASQKNYISLYLTPMAGDVDLVGANKKQLGKVSVGKCCVRFKQLADLNLPLALELIQRAAKLRQKC